MTVAYLLDTDRIIHWLNGNPEIGRRLDEARYYSKTPEENERRLDDFLAGMTLLGIDRETCAVFGRERGRLRANRTAVADFDLLIAATALRHRLALFTNNRRDFERVEGLTIESL